MYMCVSRIDFASVSPMFGFYFGTVPIVWHFFVFLFYRTNNAITPLSYPTRQKEN